MEANKMAPEEREDALENALMELMYSDWIHLSEAEKQKARADRKREVDLRRKRFREAVDAATARHETLMQRAKNSDDRSVGRMLEAVLNLHSPEDYYGLVCDHCLDEYGRPTQWPCATYSSIAEISEDRDI